jgi:putative FmdB family regulatory protein
MPIYEYRCSACGADFERLQRVSDATPACPTCGSRDEVARRVSLSAFHLKGTGWYASDYRAGGASTSRSESGGDGSGSGASAADTSASSSHSCGASCGCGPKPAAG